MDLYKYVPAERIDILEKSLIRFTQPLALNDPFEAQPIFDEIKTKEGFAKVFAETIRQVTPTKWQDIRHGVQTSLDQHTFADKVEKEPDYVEQLSYTVGMQPIISEAQDEVDQLSKTVGILSLSETPDSLLMWAHYTDGHTGFVLILDGSHDFFKGDNSSPGFSKPDRVEYYSERPSIIFGKENLLKIFLRKGSDWKYEREWRYLKFLTNAHKKTKDVNDQDVHLFRLPSKCIKGVILGCYSSEELKSKILELRRDDPEFGHLQILKARISQTDYGLEIKKIET